MEWQDLLYSGNQCHCGCCVHPVTTAISFSSQHLATPQPSVWNVFQLTLAMTWPAPTCCYTTCQGIISSQWRHKSRHLWKVASKDPPQYLSPTGSQDSQLTGYSLEAQASHKLRCPKELSAGPALIKICSVVFNRGRKGPALNAFANPDFNY